MRVTVAFASPSGEVATHFTGLSCPIGNGRLPQKLHMLGWPMAVRSGVDGKPALDVARRVRAFRTQAGMTQDELARAAKVTPKFLSQLENGHVNASIAVLARVVEDGLSMPLATFFGADPDDDVVAEVSTIVALLAGQPEPVRRCAIRLIRALLENDRQDESVTLKRSVSSRKRADTYDR